MATYVRKIPILDCGHEYIRKILHGRWKIALLIRISDGITRPGEISRSIPQATRRVLDAQLGELLMHNLIKKEVYNEAVPHVEYLLTDLGQSLMPVINLMGQWGEDNIETLKSAVK
ncbi:winged helix-turn-helix transcriptional regulator [Pedobacter hartonius]|uniref:Transcriptional regulator, HxlR family n=1 Tax=Pedobacter hartonius TaxID=425514 RepID=A0A1H3VZC5_9SPHI|nr:winged helix-turn-helix transcriptional regulator [Pedobacter hartonius]SDZ80159.1 transcriptional regulator, HxlR family [Pedobacter hartonius]